MLVQVSKLLRKSFLGDGDLVVDGAVDDVVAQGDEHQAASLYYALFLSTSPLLPLKLNQCIISATVIGQCIQEIIQTKYEYINRCKIFSQCITGIRSPDSC